MFNLKKVFILDKKILSVGIIVSFFISFMFLYISNIHIDMMLSPASSALGTLTGQGISQGINYTYFLLFIMTIPIPFIILFSAASKYAKKDYSLLLAPFLVSISILLIDGFDIVNIFSAIGLLIAFFIVFNGAFKSTEIYKKPPYRSLARKSILTAFSVFALVFAAGIFVFLSGEPHYASDEINSILTSMLNMTENDLKNIQQVFIEKQKEANYMLLENVEQALMYSLMQKPYGLSSQESAKCISAFNQSLGEIDASAKKNIDDQLKNAASSGGLETGSMNMLINMLDLMKKSYPAITAVMVFFAMQSIAFLSGILLYIYLFFVRFGETDAKADAKESAGAKK